MEFYACNEHVEEAIDHIVDECETAPQLEKVEERLAQCSFCQDQVVYKISG